MKIHSQRQVSSQAAGLSRVENQNQAVNGSFGTKSLHQAPKPPSLLSDDHLQYCLAIKEKVNPKSEEFKLVYGASGPDLSVPLFSTNATESLCLDNHRLDISKLGDLLKGDPVALYDTNQISLQVYEDLMSCLGGQQVVLDEALKSRTNNGYWLASSIGALGLERSIAIELDKLGVDLKKVELSDSKVEPFKIEFQWAFPGEAPKKRTISFQTAMLPEALKGLDFSEDHAYLQKSGMYTQNKRSMRGSINIILRTAKQGFFIISGKPLSTKEIANSKTVREYFGDNIASKIREIHIDSQNRNLTSYGQQILLAQV